MGQVLIYISLGDVKKKNVSPERNCNPQSKLRHVR